MGVAIQHGRLLEQQVKRGEATSKTRGLDLEEVRRRKEDEGLQLRKSKREKQVSYSDVITSVQEDLDTSPDLRLLS